MKLFQIEEPDGSPVDADAPGAAIGIDLSGAQAEVAIAVGGNAAVLCDREGFALDLAVPASDASPDRWRELIEGARLRAERALAQPVTHAVVILAAAEPDLAGRLRAAAAAAGVSLLDIIGPERTAATDSRACAAAVLAEDLAPRPAAP